MNPNNLLTLSDSYKISHHRLLPPGANQLYSYFESRGGYSRTTMFFGLQYFLQEYLSKGFTKQDVDEASALYADHFGDANLFNRDGWLKMLERHGGHFPVCIEAVDEGTSVPVSNVLMTVRNTDDDFPWLTNFIESLLVQVWYPCSVATQSRHMRLRILDALHQSGDPTGIDFKLHDFGFRGSTSPESAALGGAAHLVNFKGSDTVPALILARNVYDEPMAGLSIPASEHSTITSWGRDREVEAYRNLLEQYPTGFVACVSDSYDIYTACMEHWGKTLKEQVLTRDGVLVVRPDSGDPVYSVNNVLRWLAGAFGTRYNTKGYRVLNDKVRVIQGDGIDRGMVDAILSDIIADGWSADNIAFGSGGGLLQNVNRDTHKFAFKASAIRIGADWQDIFKQPVTDYSKASKAGLVTLVTHNGEFKTLDRREYQGTAALTVVFEDGKMTYRQKFSDIRERAKADESDR